MRKYFTEDGRQWQSTRGTPRPLTGSDIKLTVVDLLQGNLSVLRQALLSFIREHKGFRLLRRRH